GRPVAVEDRLGQPGKGIHAGLRPHGRLLQIIRDELTAEADDGWDVHRPPVDWHRRAVDADVVLVEASLVATLALHVDGQTLANLVEVVGRPDLVVLVIDGPGNFYPGVLNHFLVDE